jgi:hypothetical protein
MAPVVDAQALKFIEIAPERASFVVRSGLDF